MKAIWISETCYRFTQGKIYELMPCSIPQANSCDVIDDHDTRLIYPNESRYWKPLDDHRMETINEILK